WPLVKSQLFPATPEDGAIVGFPFLPGTLQRTQKDGGVDGIREKNDPYIKLQLQATSLGEVVIKGVCSNRYLAMNRDGRLFGTSHRRMLLLRRTGQYKSGKRTGPGQKAILFLPMSAKC
uniref:Fibroblast growth factor n=1 Tax=Gouania willdenowi TaxID=441366 RepID=A0A8C5GF92_GOUWI